MIAWSCCDSIRSSGRPTLIMVGQGGFNLSCMDNSDRYSAFALFPVPHPPLPCIAVYQKPNADFMHKKSTLTGWIAVHTNSSTISVPTQSAVVNRLSGKTHHGKTRWCHYSRSKMAHSRGKFHGAGSVAAPTGLPEPARPVREWSQQRVAPGSDK